MEFIFVDETRCGFVQFFFLREAAASVYRVEKPFHRYMTLVISRDVNITVVR